ncbi:MULTISPECIES: capsular biosynthesis protein [unclassified Pseudomonas]|uniref:capsular biosynthesis protein n=1 Tax=unclassified Pseudomonas TaxID=196821 RepID=UPI00224B4A97|nr:MULTISPECIES: capsular biosynthesis protein [unclassified Pseudomonas]MCX2817574.1 capsular biosynthesis protein [Pseudomonas sp. DCB_E]MCX9145337.1 capsular biosynthesis protein [Pseudomonas sp. DCB_Q]
MKRIIMDLDDTICSTINGDYKNSSANNDVIEKMHHYKSLGFEIIINTARNMRTHSGNLGKINALTLPTIIEWLERHGVPYDELYVGKPWCGNEGFYVDDKAIRPDEFSRLSYDEIKAITGIN